MPVKNQIIRTKYRMDMEKFSFYKEHPKTCAPDDYWGQVKRTVNGRPVSKEQIDMIVAAVCSELELTRDDILLDLCCGNGALSTLLFDHCAGGLGVDFSEYLISVAKRDFSSPPERTYILQDVVEFCENPQSPEKFTQYGFSDKQIAKRLLNENFPNIRRMFIGNCPDKDQMKEFFGDRNVVAGVEADPDSPIGIWRTQQEFISLAESCGWHGSIHKMPDQYYASHYRYDVILFR